MEVSAVNPFKFLVVTRVFATTLMLPVLVMYNALVGMMGSFLDVHLNEDTSLTTFFDNAFSTITFLDIFTTLAKSLVFGFTIGIVGCYQGYHASQGTQGVGRAANASVVASMFLIFIEEVLIVQIATWLRTPS
jgi:phospholipid/cholesterol/gamma-HCH transport system permease protein